MCLSISPDLVMQHVPALAALQLMLLADKQVMHAIKYLMCFPNNSLIWTQNNQKETLKLF